MKKLTAGTASRIVAGAKETLLKYKSQFDGYIVKKEQMIEDRVEYMKAGYNGEKLIVIAEFDNNGYKEWRKIGHWCFTFNEGEVYCDINGKNKEYKKFHYFVQAIEKIFNTKAERNMILSQGIFNLKEYYDAIIFMSKKGFDQLEVAKEIENATRDEKIMKVLELFRTKDTFIKEKDMSISEFIFDHDYRVDEFEFELGKQVYKTVSETLTALVKEMVAGTLTDKRLVEKMIKIANEYREYDRLGIDADADTTILEIKYKNRCIDTEEFDMEYSDIEEFEEKLESYGLRYVEEDGIIIGIYNPLEQLEGQVSLDEINILDAVIEIIDDVVEIINAPTATPAEKIEVVTTEVNADGTTTQKRKLSEYIYDTLGLPKSENISVEGSTKITEGYSIEGFKIKYNVEQTLMDYSEDRIDYHTEKAIVSTKLMELFVKLQHEFDIRPNISTITDSTNATRISTYVFKKEECDTYKVIDFVEITKEKHIIYDIDNVRTIDLDTIKKVEVIDSLPEHITVDYMLEMADNLVIQEEKIEEVVTIDKKQLKQPEEIKLETVDVNIKRLTKMEIEFLNAMRNNNYSDILETDGDWYFGVTDELDYNLEQANGVATSLKKKGLVESHHYGLDHMIAFTDRGKKLFDNADGEPCGWGGKPLLKNKIE